MYTSIQDLIPVRDKIVADMLNADFDSVDLLLKNFLTTLISENTDEEQAIMIYNALLCLIDGIAQKPAHDNLSAQHVRVLRDFCREKRKNILEADLSELEIKAILEQHATQNPNFNAVQIAGIRKNIRITRNTGIVSPYLVEREPEYAVMAGVTWSPINPSHLLDAGFLFAPGEKFDCHKTFSIKDIKLAKDVNKGLIPEEYSIICRLLIEQCLQVYGKSLTKTILESAVKSTIAKIPAKAGELGFQKIKDYAQLMGININIPDENVEEWAKWLLATSSKSAMPRIGNSVNIDKTNIDYGIELLYPLVPLFSKEWTNIVNNPKIVSSGFRLSFVATTLLHYGGYECGIGIKMRVLSYSSCSFIIGADQDYMTRIAETSVAKNLCVPYVSQMSCVSSNTSVEFSLDDLLTKKIFPDNGVFVVTPKIFPITNIPQQTTPYPLSSNVTVAKTNKFEENDVFAIVPFGMNITEQCPVWGTPVDRDDVYAILPFLDFLPGQEQDASQTTIMCRLITEEIGTVKKAIESTPTKRFLFIKTKDKWMY